MLKGSTYYLKKSMLFFDLKSRNLPIVVFLFLLAANSVLSFYQIDPFTMTINDFIVLIGYEVTCSIISVIYLIGAIKDISGEEYSFGSCAHNMVIRIFILLAVILIRLLLIFLGAFVLVVPALIIGTMFYFVEAIIIDQNASVIQAFKTSYKLTLGKKLQLFKINIFCVLIVYIIGTPVILLFSGYTSAVSIYTSAFVSSIMTLIDTRRLALLYTDMLGH